MKRSPSISRCARVSWSRRAWSSEPPSLWMVVNVGTGGDPSMRRAHFVHVVGRIKDDVTFEAAQRDMDAIGHRNEELYPETNKGHLPSSRCLLRDGVLRRWIDLRPRACVAGHRTDCLAGAWHREPDDDTGREIPQRSGGRRGRRSGARVVRRRPHAADTDLPAEHRFRERRGKPSDDDAESSVPDGRTPTRYSTQEAVHRFYDSVQKEVERVPGVRSVTIGGVLPLDGMWIGQGVDIEGDAPRQGPSQKNASYQMISPSYFETLDIPIIRGRAFTDADNRGGAPVCIVSEAFVQRYLNGREPLGLRVGVPAMSFPAGAPVMREIVGVARQVTMFPNEPQPIAQLYVPIAQNAWFFASLSVRPQSGFAEALLPAGRAAVARVDKERPVTRVRTIDVAAAEATSRPRFRAVLVGTFAALALGLAMVGVFGVLAYSVQQRVREFGVRIAMGAAASDVMRLVLGSAARLTLIGLAIGLIAAAALTRYLGTLLYNVKPLDPLTFMGVPVVLIVTAVFAVAAPAWRAARVDPVVAFRVE